MGLLKSFGVRVCLNISILALVWLSKASFWSSKLRVSSKDLLAMSRISSLLESDFSATWRCLVIKSFWVSRVSFERLYCCWAICLPMEAAFPP